MIHRSGGGRRGVAMLVTVALPVLAVVLGGCSTTSGLCDQAAALAAAGRLSEATERYALAELRGDGDCAGEGLASAASRHTELHRHLARARDAEEARNLDGALGAYRAALTIDAGHPAARDGLTRLGQPAPEFHATDPAPPPSDPAPAPDGSSRWLLLAGVALSIVALGVLGWLVWWGRRAVTALRSTVQDAIRQVEAATSASSEAQQKLISEVCDGVGNLRTGVEAAVDGRLATVHRHLDEIADYIEDIRRSDGEVETIAYGSSAPRR